MNREKFQHLFDTYFEEIRSYIYYRSGDTELATDIAQDTFLKVWEKQLRFIPGKEKGLLYKIAGDIFVSQYRKQKVSRQFQSDLRAEHDKNSPEEQLIYEELNKRYKRIIEEMKEKQRIVFLMNRRDGLRYYEIADRLGIGVKAVEKRMNGALAILRKELK